MPECHDQPFPGNPNTGGCAAVAYQSAAVSVPVTVKPRVSTGHINTFCCGEPRITPSPYQIMCAGKSDSCRFILTQTVCIEIPIEFSAGVLTGCPCVCCGEVTTAPCQGCDG